MDDLTTELFKSKPMIKNYFQAIKAAIANPVESLKSE
jgi:hypothetical protein